MVGKLNAKVEEAKKTVLKQVGEPLAKGLNKIDVLGCKPKIDAANLQAIPTRLSEHLNCVTESATAKVEAQLDKWTGGAVGVLKRTKSAVQCLTSGWVCPDSWDFSSPPSAPRCKKLPKPANFDIGKIFNAMMPDPKKVGVKPEKDPLGFVTAAFNQLITNAKPITDKFDQLFALVKKPDFEGLVDFAWERLKDATAFVPAVACITGFIEPYYPPLKKAVAGFAKGAMDAMKKLGDFVLAPLQGFLAEGLTGLLSLVPSDLKDRLKAIVDQVVAAQNMVGETISKLIAGFKGKGNADALKAMIADARKWKPELGIEVLMQYLKGEAYKFVTEKIGGFIDDFLGGISSFVVGGIQSLTTAVCGLIPEAGGAICAATVLPVMRTVWDLLARGFVRGELLKAVNRVVDDAVAYLKGTLLGALKKVTASVPESLKNLVGMLGGLVDAAQKFIATHIVPAFSKSTNGVFDQLDKLVIELPSFQLPSCTQQKK